MAYITNVMSGLASARPTATGSGKLYFADDIPAVSIDDPATGAWKPYGIHGYVPGPGLVANFTTVGNIGIINKGDSIVAWTTSSGNSCLVQAIPAALLNKPWAVDVMGWLQQQNETQYPQFGVCVTNGIVSGTSTIYHMTRYASSNGWGAFHDTFTSGQSGKVSLKNQDGNYDLIQPGFAINVRLVSDNTNLYYQLSSDGQFWRHWVSEALPASIAYYGAFIGTDQSSGFSGGHLQKLRIKSPLQFSISTITFSSPNATVTTTAAHGMATGMSISLTGVSVSTGTNPNGFYDSSVTVTGTTTFTVPTSSFTGGSGGTVTNLSQ